MKKETNPFEEEANKWKNEFDKLKQAALKKKLNDEAIIRARMLADQVSFFKEENDLLSGKLLSAEELAEQAGKDMVLIKQSKLLAQYPNNPRCNCGCVMVERTNKNTGDKFWGCSNYPKCTGTAKIWIHRRKH